MHDKLYMTVEAVADMLKIKPDSLRHRINRTLGHRRERGATTVYLGDGLTAVKLDSSKRWMIRRDA